ncbi:MAG: type II toxin-antitoxin system Phd/YefM family antitoxin [Desulfurivibrio sp.]|nr:MAG: type II toxin-antitoxin system Phd/YefM family antitoxin [Desulfurivibrio sp.]
MKATVVDLRYKMNDVLKALDRNEKVTVFYRGKEKGVLVPSAPKKHLKITDHPFFGMSSQDTAKAVLAELNDLRKPRYDDI